MKDIKKILLATTDGLASHHGEMRAALLGAQLGLDGFDMLTVKRAALPFGSAATEFSHIQVRGPDLSAWIAGAPQAISALGEADDLAPIWNKAPVTAAELVVEAARKTGAELTILAPYRRNALLELLAPADSRDILRHSRNNLLLVHSQPRDLYRKVLVAVDFSTESKLAALAALRLAPEAQFHFVHAYRLPDEGLMRELQLAPAVIGGYLARGIQGAWEQLNTWIADLGPAAQPCVGAVHSGFPVQVLNANARRLGADLIVVGRQGLTRAARYGLGDIARRLGNQAPCDVLIGAPLASRPSASLANARLVRAALAGTAGNPDGQPHAAVHCVSR